jgi:(2Fe-2S) ferredoxin
MVEVHEEGKSVVIYGNLDSEKARKIVANHILSGKPVTEFVIEVK